MIDDDLTIGLLLVAAGMLWYLLPVVLAFLWRHPRRYVLAAVSVLLGWTGLGWFVALGWAMHGRPGRQQTRPNDDDPDAHRVLPRDIEEAIEDIKDDD